MPGIAIVGAGISGLHLALKLQQAGVDTTLYTERTSAQIATGRPVNLVVRFEHTLARERKLGVAYWDSPDHNMYGVNFDARTDPPLGFFGMLRRPASAVDFRIYLPRLMADYAERGGTVEVLPADAESVARLGSRHDLVVVASGRRSVAELFARDPDRSPFQQPQRILCAGFFTGIAPMPERGLHYQLCPGAGEIFSTRFLTFGGTVHAMNIETIPGGPLAHLPALDYEADPVAFNKAVLDALAEHAPALRERVNAKEFGLTGPNDLLQGGITPTVRTGWAALPGGAHAIAVGDAWVVNDPVTGQGANLGSHSAFTLADAIVAGPPYGEEFCRRAEAAMWEFARPVTEWTNAFLLPPPRHGIEVLAAGSRDVRIADAFVELFNDPPAMWAMMGSPEGAAEWLAGFEQLPSPAAAHG